MKYPLKKIISFFNIIFLLLFLISPSFVIAGTITTASDTLSRIKASTASDHTILFVTPSGLASGGNMTFTFSAGFTGVGSMTSEDFDLAEGSTGVCSSATFTEKSVKTTPTASDFSAIGSGQVVTVLSGGASATLTAGRCIRLKAGLNATNTTGAGPGNTQITNGAIGSSDTITIGGGFGDSGTISIDIVDDDQVSITATVNQSLSFDLDTYNTSTTSTETGTPYSVALGTLSTGSVIGTTEGGASTPNGIWFDINTNASGGAVISVLSANASLKSTSTPADTIPSASAAMSAGTANYGICANRNAATTGTLTKVSPFDQTCSTTPSANTVGAVTTTAQTIYKTGSTPAPISAGRGEIMVDAAISGVTPAHTDYADTLTFIATGTF